MADLSSAGRSRYGRAQRRQITNDRQQDSHDTCLAKINLAQHDDLINYAEDRHRDEDFAEDQRESAATLLSRCVCQNAPSTIQMTDPK